MAIIELSLKETYIPTWGSWECVREAMQNGLDEDIRGHKLTVKYKDGQLIIYNEGADMTTEVLLMGHTDKTDNPELSGEHGEGLDVGMLAGVRCGYEIKIVTQTETWTPVIEHSEQYNARVLKVQTRKLQKRRDGVTVTIKMEEQVWEEAKDLFLKFARLDRDKDLIEIEGQGSIVTDLAYKGRVYVKGIFIQHIPELSYGYDLLGFKVDRDRRLIDTWDMKWKLATMYQEAVAQRPEAMVAPVYAMLRDNKLDTQGLRHNSDTKTREAMASRFIEEHGDDAIPVDSIGESNSITHAGRHGVVVNDTMKELLASSKIKTALEVRRELTESVTKIYSWDDLDSDERANLTAAAHALDTAVSTVTEQEHPPILNRVKIVDFLQEILDGLVKGNEISMARSLLVSKEEILKALVHEEAHIISDADDGLAAHVQTIEKLWSALYWKDKEDAKPTLN